MVSSLASASIVTGLGTLPQESSLAVSAVAARLPHTLLIALLAFFNATTYTSILLTPPATTPSGGSSGGCSSSAHRAAADSEAEGGDVRARICYNSCSAFWTRAWGRVGRLMNLRRAVRSIRRVRVC